MCLFVNAITIRIHQIVARKFECGARDPILGYTDCFTELGSSRHSGSRVS
jgi:hypothetical protein